MNENDETRLRHMLDEAQKAQRFTQGRIRNDFDTDEMFAYAVVRAIELIGEAASQVSQETRAELQAIPWKRVIGLRNIVIHNYTAVNYDIIWQVIERNIPELVEQLSVLLPPDKFEDE